MNAATVSHIEYRVVRDGFHERKFVSLHVLSEEIMTFKYAVVCVCLFTHYFIGVIYITIELITILITGV